MTVGCPQVKNQTNKLKTKIKAPYHMLVSFSPESVFFFHSSDTSGSYVLNLVLSISCYLQERYSVKNLLGHARRELPLSLSFNSYQFLLQAPLTISCTSVSVCLSLSPHSHSHTHTQTHVYIS